MTIMKSIFTWLSLTCTALFAIVHLKAQTTEWVSLSTQSAGLDTSRAFNIFVADINNDHYPDMVTLRGNWIVGRANVLKVYINVPDTATTEPGARMFVDITEESGANAMPDPGDISRGVIVAALADVNNDGNIDIVRGNYYHDKPDAAPDDRCEVLLGDGKGHFSIVPNNGLHELGVINATAFSFLDYDKDGNIDLFIARWFDNYAQNSNLWSPGILMKGNGDGTFTDVSAQAGITIPEPMYGCSAVDWNNDGWPDIATAPYCRTGGQLWKNNGDGTFTNVAGQAGYNAKYMQGYGGRDLCMWSAAPEDFDNDGDMDFFFSLVHGGMLPHEGRSAIAVNGGAADQYRLNITRDLITRKNPQSSHMGDYDGSWFDLDNDGLIDLAMTQGTYETVRDRVYIFRQQADHTFMDITQDLGLIITETNNPHLLEALDYDLDGDDDIIICKTALPREVHLIDNRIGQDNNWTGIHLRAPQGVNKSCIGARIYVWSGGVQRMREVYAGRGNNGGQQPFALLFGLGSKTSIDSITVAWPDAAGSMTTVLNPPVNRYLEITGNGLAVDDFRNDGKEVGLKLYPNPAKDFILVQMSNNEPIKRVDVYDMTGRRINRTEPTGPYQPVVYCALNGLNPGQYMISVITKEDGRFSLPFIKRS